MPQPIPDGALDQDGHELPDRPTVELLQCVRDRLVDRRGPLMGEPVAQPLREMLEGLGFARPGAWLAHASVKHPEAGALHAQIGGFPRSDHCPVLFTLLWSTRHMAVTRLTGIDGRLELTLEGLTFRRSKSAALARGTRRLHQVEWPHILGAEVAWSRKGRPLVRIVVAGAPRASRHREDPHAIKVPRKSAAQAVEFVELVNEEIALRRRWRAAAPTGQEDPSDGVDGSPDDDEDGELAPGA